MLPIVTQGWTLNYEMLFYLVFAGGLFLKRVPALITITALFLMLALYGLILKHNDPTRPAQTVLEFYTHFISMLFVVGAWIGYCAEKYGLTFMKLRHPFIVLGLLLSLAFLTYYLIRDDASFGWFLFYAAIAVACVIACTFETSTTALSRIFEILGEASYSTYLTHLLALTVLHKLALRLTPHMNPFLFAAIGLVVANGVGYVAYRLVERPLLKGGMKLIKRKSSS